MNTLDPLPQLITPPVVDVNIYPVNVGYALGNVYKNDDDKGGACNVI